MFRCLLLLLGIVSTTVCAQTVTTSVNGASFTTTITASNAFHVTVAPPPADVDSTQKVYLALLAFGRVLFIGADGKFQEYIDGVEMPAVFSHAQSECRTGNTFGLTYSVGIDLAKLPQNIPGAAYYVGYGADQKDLLQNLKFAPVYVVPTK